MTGDVVSQPPPSENHSPKGGERNIGSVQNRVASLHAQLQAVDQESSRLQERLNSLRSEADDLFQKVDQLHPPPQLKEEPTAQKSVRDVPYRPSLERESKKDSHQFWVQGDRIVPMKKFQDMCQEIDRQLGIKKRKVTAQISIWDDSFIVEGDFVLSDSALGYMELKQSRLALRLNPAAAGEASEQLALPESQFRRKLAESDPSKVAVTFEVLPDSFETYRIARKVAWDLGFDVGWEPLKAGQAMEFGVGGARTQ